MTNARQAIGLLLDRYIPRTNKRITDEAFCELQDKLVEAFEWLQTLREFARIAEGAENQ